MKSTHRYFDWVRGFDNPNSIKLPRRSTPRSAGYDFFAPYEETIPSIWPQVIKAIFKKTPILPTLIYTHVKAHMRGNEYLALYNRSSNPLNRGLVLANGVAVIDSDYCGNPNNDGNIAVPFYNFMPYPIRIKPGDKIAQGIFHTYLRTWNDDPDVTERSGGLGSTGA